MPISIKDWAVAETVTGVKLNAHLSDNLNLLKNKNIAVRTIATTQNSEIGRIANTAVPFDSPIRLTHTMSKTGTILARFWLPAIVRRHTGTLTNTQGRIDVRVDDDWFLTSRLPAPLTDGLLVHSIGNLNYQINLVGHFIIDNVEKGEHTYELFGAATDVRFSMEVLAGGEWSIEEHTENIADFLLLGEPL